jgi:hypothetical protein
MNEAEHNPHPIQILFNYWEARPAVTGARLDALIRQGINHITTFVPWQVVESDITHTLVRFLQSVSDRKMTVDLILTPELGVHYPNSGMPKDLMAAHPSTMASHGSGKADNLASHVGGQPIAVTLPPNGFQLPSLFSPELTKRYCSFMSRLDSLLADLNRTQPQLLAGVRAVLTGSFWKYYRSPQASARGAFDGMAGDYGPSAGLAYRQRLEQYFGGREFSDPSPMAANRWKTRGLDEVNRRWFQQHSEDVFRNRSFQLVRKKSGAVKLVEMELHTPEADPGLTYSNVMTLLSGGHGDVSRLSSLIDDASARASHASSGPALGYVHWTSFGPFRGLADPEKQFLILKSLLLMGGRGGGILVDEDEWFALSPSFRARAETFAKSLASGELSLRNRALYLSPHLWSGAGTLWAELQARVGSGARMISSLELLTREREASLLIVDPAWILTRESIQALTAWAAGGRVVVLPRSPLYTEQARLELDRLLARTKKIEIDLGVPYRLHGLGEGKLVVYDLPENLSMAGEALSSWQTFLTAVLSVAEVQGYCRLSDSRLGVIPLEMRGRGLGLFVLNGTRRPVSADILFQEDVSVSDLARTLAAAHGPHVSTASRPAPANRFSLDVPPCGVLPLAVDGAGMHEARLRAEERRLALSHGDATRSGAEQAAMSELPGYEPDRGTGHSAHGGSHGAAHGLSQADPGLPRLPGEGAWN